MLWAPRGSGEVPPPNYRVWKLPSEVGTLLMDTCSSPYRELVQGTRQSSCEFEEDPCFSCEAGALGRGNERCPLCFLPGGKCALPLMTVNR